MSDSILTSTKKALGIDAAYTAFDEDIIMHINSSFSTLNQLGIGPIDGFAIVDAIATWDTFLNGNKKFNSVKTYVYLNVRMIFDPPTTSYFLTALQEQIKESVWRLSVLREFQSTVLLGGFKTITGNLGDEHHIRLTNPVGETLIYAGGLYSAEFVSRTGRSTDSVTLDTSQIASGILFLSAVINDGTYIIRRLNPQRTILVLDVRVQ